MRATLTEDYFSSADWLYERKLDGQRCLAYVRAGAVNLYSPRKQPLEDTYPEIATALEHQSDKNMIIDGEVVAFDGAVTSFSRLQGRMGISNPENARNSGITVYFYVFDLLYFDGYDVSALPLRLRKSLLRNAMRFKNPLRFTVHRNSNGRKFLDTACQKGWEGLIAKRATSPYKNTRSRDWLKFKCSHQQEFVIGGYTEPTGQRTGFGALLLGYYENEKLHYAGKVGTGFDRTTLTELHRILKNRQRRRTPFTQPPESGNRKMIHWVNPTLVCEAGFTEWTDDGYLRHPRFLGLRDDKPAKKVVKEKPG